MYIGRLLIDNFLLLQIRWDIAVHDFFSSDRGEFMQLCKEILIWTRHLSGVICKIYNNIIY